jgi:hypothetical protein
MPETTTIKTEAEKMVPIDTSGESVDVELKEEKEKVIETSDAIITPVVEEVKEEIVEVKKEEKETPVETKEEELEEYSAGVKKRIDKLTKKMREAERREQAAIEYAEGVKKKFDTLQSSTLVQTDTMLAEREKALTNQREFAKRALEAAVGAQDVEKQVAAQQEIARLTIEDERLKVSKAKALQRKNQQEQEVQKESEAGPADLQPPRPRDRKAEGWALKNEWFGSETAMTYTAYDIHRELVEEGVDPRTDEYYNEIDKRIRKEFPHKFSDGGNVIKPKQKVASAVRTSPSGRRTVRLTPSQVAISKKLGVPLEEYAKYVKEA